MKKRVSESQTEQVYMVRSPHINGYGRLFGGQLVQWIDEIAGIVARRHSCSNITTAAIDNLSFKAAAFVNDTVVLSGKVTYVGKSSMEITVDAFVEDLTGQRQTINRAYIVMVAIDGEGNPVPVPGLLLESEEEKAEWERGEKRYALRKIRQKEGY